MEEKDLLALVESDMITEDIIDRISVVIKESTYLKEKHKYKIWEGEDKYWRTYIEDKSVSAGRKLIRKKSYVDLKKFLIHHYKEMEDNLTIEEVFTEWLKERYYLHKAISKATYDRYESDFNRFFGQNPLAKRQIISVTQEELENYIYSVISDKELTARAWGNFKFLINSIWKYAYKKDKRVFQPAAVLDNLDFGKNTFKKKIRNSNTEIYTREEMARLEMYLREKMEISPKLNYCAILLAIYSGMRIGEILGLTKDDVFIGEKEKFIYVRHTQTRYKDEETGKIKHVILEQPKTLAGYRMIPISEDIMYVISWLEKLYQNNPNKYYFYRTNGRTEKGGDVLTKHCVGMSLHYVEDKIGLIQHRGLHSLRKTFASNLISLGMSKESIIAVMGHTDISTTERFYLYNTCDMEEIMYKMEQYTRLIKRNHE